MLKIDGFFRNLCLKRDLIIVQEIIKMKTKEQIAEKMYGKPYEECCSREKARIMGVLFVEEEKDASQDESAPSKNRSVTP